MTSNDDMEYDMTTERPGRTMTRRDASRILKDYSEPMWIQDRPEPNIVESIFYAVAFIAVAITAALAAWGFFI